MFRCVRALVLMAPLFALSCQQDDLLLPPEPSGALTGASAETDRLCDLAREVFGEGNRAGRIAVGKTCTWVIKIELFSIRPDDKAAEEAIAAIQYILGRCDAGKCFNELGAFELILGIVELAGLDGFELLEGGRFVICTTDPCTFEGEGVGGVFTGVEDADGEPVTTFIVRFQSIDPPAELGDAAHVPWFFVTTFPKNLTFGASDAPLGQETVTVHCVPDLGPDAPDPDVAARLFLARFVNGQLDPRPRRFPDLVNCVDVAAATSLLERVADLFTATPLYAMPGRLGAAITAFSPIGPVDPQIVLEFDGIAAGSKDPVVSLRIGAVPVGNAPTGGTGCTDMSTIYDTSAATGAALDLDAQSQQGEVLIVRRRPPPVRDCPAGGTLSFDFSASDGLVLHPVGTVTVVELKVLDFEEAGSVDLFGPGGAPLGSFVTPTTPNGGLATMSLGPTSGVERMVVNLAGSGAIDDVVVRIEPAP
jgi:hypothetical protein